MVPRNAGSVDGVDEHGGRPTKRRRSDSGSGSESESNDEADQARRGPGNASFLRARPVHCLQLRTDASGGEAMAARESSSSSSSPSVLAASNGYRGARIPGGAAPVIALVPRTTVPQRSSTQLAYKYKPLGHGSAGPEATPAPPPSARVAGDRKFDTKRGTAAGDAAREQGSSKKEKKQKRHRE